MHQTLTSLKIGLIREGKTPSDNRVALTPAQCRWLMKACSNLKIFAQPSPSRCFPDNEYELAGVVLQEDLSACDYLFGIKEVPVDMLIPEKTYLFFSHTRKMQPSNQQMLQEIMRRKITLVDYECLEHKDGGRIIGFGYFAGIVGAHNGMRAYGNRTRTFLLEKVNSSKNLRYLFRSYFGLSIPNIKIAITGGGRVAKGLLEIMNRMGIHQVEPQDYLTKTFSYPVYVRLTGGDLYEDENGKYVREDFHKNPERYRCKFTDYLPHTDILMNGIYWDVNIPRLFSMEDMRRPDFRIRTIADVTDDLQGSVPCNLGDSTIEDPVYGVDRFTGERTEPYLENSVDIMAVGNLPNELPRDASRYFGEQLIKYVLQELFSGTSEMIDRATIVRKGKLNEPFEYLRDYAEGKMNAITT